MWIVGIGVLLKNNNQKMDREGRKKDNKQGENGGEKS